MSNNYSILVDTNGTSQDIHHNSFIGGQPKLPGNVNIPRCKLCGNEQTFFFQIAFPFGNPWAGTSVAIFSCTSCADENYLIPEMLNGPLHGINIPHSFLINYQRNFCFEVFETNTGQIQRGYIEKVAFHELRLVPGEFQNSIGYVGGSPNWILGDESPAFYNSTIPMIFLFQLPLGIRFEKIPNAPPQTEIGLTRKPESSPDNFYELFLGNALYFFGTLDNSNKLVYVVTQSE